MTLHRALALAMLLAGGGVTAYGLAGFASTSSPLRVVILVVFVLPALPAFVLGWSMLRGRAWALRGLRAYVLALVGAAALMAFGLNVSAVAEPAFAVPFLAFCLGWWALSWRVGRVAGADHGADPAP